MKSSILNRQLWVATLLCLVSLGSYGNQTDLREISFYTEEYPPGNYLDDGVITGHSVEILLEASALIGEPVNRDQVTLQAWPASYSTVLTQKNTILFSTNRSEHRENLFKWVGPIVDVKLVVLARKDANITVGTPLDMAKYKVGVVKDGIGEQMLLNLGIPRQSMQESTHATALLEKLMKNRIDLLVYGERGASWWSKQVGIDPNLFETIYVLDQGSIYYAVNKDTDDSVVNKLQNGLNQLKQQNLSGRSRYDEILDKF